LPQRDASLILFPLQTFRPAIAQYRQIDFWTKRGKLFGNLESNCRLSILASIALIITATAMVATVVDASAFKSGRHFAAWIGLVPQLNGTGGKVHLGRISKKGEPYLRRLLVLGATAVVRYARNKPEFAGWVNALLARRRARVVTIAVANKLARIVWAIMRRGGSFRERPLGIA
jgi:transposase